MKLPDLDPRDGALMGIVGIYVALSVYFLFLYKGMWWDEAVYLGLSEGIQNGYYSLKAGVAIDSFRAPLFPSILAVLGITKPFPARIVTLLFGTGTIYLVYRLGLEAFDRRGGLMAAAAMSSFHLFSYFQSKILTETLFTFILALSLLFFLRREQPRYSFLTGFASGLAFITRYPGGILFILYGLYLLHDRDWRGLVYFGAGSLIPLIPLFWLGQIYFNHPLGMPLTNLEVVSGSPSPPTFFLTHYVDIFGFLGIAVGLGALAALRDRRYTVFLSLALLSVLALTLQPHKEIRYLVSFFPAFALLVPEMRRLAPERDTLVVGLLIVLALFSLKASYAAVDRDSDGGKALIEASRLLNDLPDDSPVLSEFYSPEYPGSFNGTVENPWLGILTDREIYIFPEDPRDLNGTRARYAVIYHYSPKVPDYAEEFAADNFERIESFEQWGDPESVIVYRIPEDFRS